MVKVPEAVGVSDASPVAGSMEVADAFVAEME